MYIKERKKTQVKLINHDCLPILMLLYIMLADLMLFVWIMLFYFIFCNIFLAIYFCKCFLFSCFVLVFLYIVCLFHVLISIMHSAFNLLVFPNSMFTA